MSTETEKRLKVGDFVRFNALNGSTGKVTSIRDDGPFKAKPMYYVEWVYGKDVKGERITERSGLKNDYELVVITESEYLRVADGPAFKGT